ncbi:hypothetical protein [Nonomuraea endophytica]|uniref:hypothetical protein n=1 Tax=Nonomuraea endophytica TaxID=714136 RepID=UPI0037C92A1C
MIIEDANGREWTLDELDNQEPDPPYECDGASPVDLDEIERLHALAVNIGVGAEAAAVSVEATVKLLSLVPYLVAELREANGDRDRCQDSARYEYAITREGAAGPDPDAHTFDGDAMADRQIADGEALWVRTVHVLAWTRLSNEPPF